MIIYDDKISDDYHSFCFIIYKNVLKNITINTNLYLFHIVLLLMDTYIGVEYFHFYCISKPPSPLVDIKKGRMFISKVWPYDEAANNTENLRCAVSILFFFYNWVYQLAHLKTYLNFKFIIKSILDRSFYFLKVLNSIYLINLIFKYIL